MSTLCVYENYLRDRYILGEPVRYMYGGFGGSNSGGSTSKPKQTVRGPDNEEYTYIDDPSSPNAGRYARQIGGNGGGKTVFLDDVQKEYQKRQMEDANKAAQPQAADKRQSVKRPAQERPARRPVIKTWNLTEIEDANGDFLDVQVKASSEDEAKQIVADALKIQRDTRKKVGGGYSWELQEILEWGERNPEKFKQAIEDAKPQVERPQAAQKTESSAPQTKQVNADSGQHGSDIVSAVDEKPKRLPANKKKEPIDKPEVSNSSIPEQQPEPVVETGADGSNDVGEAETTIPSKEANENTVDFRPGYEKILKEINDKLQIPGSNKRVLRRLKKDVEETLKKDLSFQNPSSNHFYRLYKSDLNSTQALLNLAASFQGKMALETSQASLPKKRVVILSEDHHNALNTLREIVKAGGLEGYSKEFGESIVVGDVEKYLQQVSKELTPKAFSVFASNLGIEFKSRKAKERVEELLDLFRKPRIDSAVENKPSLQEAPAKPRPKRWTPLKSKMNDDDRRVVEKTRKRLNFGFGEFAWRLANAKEKKDWQKAKELTVLASQKYLDLARRAYRSHGGAEALAAFDESLSGEGLTVGQVRDRVVDKFRQLALMNVADLHKYAGERLDEWEAFSQGAELPSTKDKIALNRLLDKPHYAPNAVPYTPPEKGKIYEVPIDSLNLDPSRFQFKLNANAQGVTDDLEGAEFDPTQAGIIHVWRDPDDGKDYVVNGHHRFNLAKNSGYDGKVNVSYIDADTADDAKAFGAVANIADQKGTAVDAAEFIRTRGSDDIRTPAGKKIATKNKLLADGRVLSKLDDTIFRKLKNGSIDEKTARIIATELPDDKDKQLRLFSDIERFGLDASQAQDRAWAYASIQGEKQQGSLFGDDAPMEYDVESRSKLIGEIRKALGGAKRAAQVGGSRRNNEYWESQKLATNFDRDRAKQLSKSAGQTLDFFKDHIRLTGPMQNIIKEETDEYRKAIKSGKGAEKVVERAIERIKDVAQGGDGSVRRVEWLGLEHEDRLPSAKSEQTRQGVEANGRGEKQKPPRTPSESLRNGTAGEVLETGGADRPSDGGDGRNLASVIAEEAKKSDIPKNRVREELDAPRQSKTSTPQEEEKPDWLKDLESQEELKPVSKGKYNPEAKPYSWKPKEPETEDDLREFWRKHVDGGLDEDFTLGSDNKKVSIGGVEGDVPMTVDEMRRFVELRLGRENRKALGLSEHFSEEELKALQSPGEKRGRGRISNATPVDKIAQEAQKSEVSQKQVQEKIVEAVSGNSNTRKSQTPSLQEPGSVTEQPKASATRRYKDVELEVSEDEIRDELRSNKLYYSVRRISDSFNTGTLALDASDLSSVAEALSSGPMRARFLINHINANRRYNNKEVARLDDFTGGKLTGALREQVKENAANILKAKGRPGLSKVASAVGFVLSPKSKAPVEEFVAGFERSMPLNTSVSDEEVEEAIQRRLTRAQEEHEAKLERAETERKRKEAEEQWRKLPSEYRSLSDYARTMLPTFREEDPYQKETILRNLDIIRRRHGVNGLKSFATIIGVPVSSKSRSANAIMEDIATNVPHVLENGKEISLEPQDILKRHEAKQQRKTGARNTSVRNAANSQALPKLKQQDARAEPLGEDVVQDRIAEAVAAVDTSKRKTVVAPKNFDPDSIKDDVEKAVSIRDADRSQLSGESMESVMSIAKDIYNKHGKDGLKEFMRSIGVVPTAGTRSKLLEELKGELGEVSANRSKGTLIRKMGAEKA